MTYFKWLFSIVLLILVVLSGCSNEDTNFKLIASEKTLPTNFYEIAFERTSPPLYHYLIDKVTNQKDFEDKWKEFGFESDIPSENLDDKIVFFIGLQESGSCPYDLETIEISSDYKTLTLPLSEPTGNCTADATPRTFVIEFGYEEGKNIEKVIIVQSEIETNIPIKD
ncbi:hypothetical protein [Bacillus sp. PS06]|uniref:hypothetical protein n=1 Tax=Bacillus sp. PS06 TaxID=2764176 RepID=UPI00177BA42F|nr:hypothetical protein [Bacillus sp. PS06]MBD8067820.1 hypothetical protein [Bacillus sp. PS06]